MSYDDIINVQWPVQNGRPKMPLSRRAKIFLPFAALRGYEESLSKVRGKNIEESEQKTTLFTEDLTEEELAFLQQKLSGVNNEER